ncbi:MAG: hypothetical protein NT166_12695 [Candidatus Aminicenantes bacterium]|nr:hypothetical protein [Candidatus Aminicenantes bacterium]
MYVLTQVTILFTLVLALSLTVERFLEVLKAVLAMVDDRLKWRHFWTRRAEALKKRLESKMGVFEYVDPKKAAAILNRFEQLLLGEKDGYTGTVPVISGDMLRSAGFKLICKSAGILLGIFMALWMQIDLLKIWHDAAGTGMTGNIPSATLRIVFSGIAIGLGSGPVHKMITAIEQKRGKKEGGAQ